MATAEIEPAATAPSPTGCACALGAACRRRPSMALTPATLMLCRTRPEMFRLFDERAGIMAAGTKFPDLRPKRNRARGLGDTIATVTGALGFRGRGCGNCGKRQRWLNKVFPYRERPLDDVDKRTVLLEFAHGLGDSIQCTVLLAHLQRLRPDLLVDVAAKRGHTRLYGGLCRSVVPFAHGSYGGYDAVYQVGWHEPRGSYWDSPSTKAAKSLREEFSLEPIPELHRYRVEIPAEAQAEADAWLVAKGFGRPIVLMHAAGNSHPGFKLLDPGAVERLCRAIRERGAEPIILDWKGVPHAAAVGAATHLGADDPLWGGLTPDRGYANWHGDHIGDGATILGLAKRAALCIGVDSGPGHCFAASGTPTIAVCQGMHPVHYWEPGNANVVHLTPWNHRDQIHEPRDAGESYFFRHYNYQFYRGSWEEELGRMAMTSLDGGSLPRQSRPDSALGGGFNLRDRWQENDRGIYNEVVVNDDYRLAEIQGPIDTAIDVGAHIGAFGWLLRQRWPSCRLVSVEANRRNIDGLRANLGGWSGILNAAVSYEPGPMVFLNPVGPHVGPSDGEVVPLPDPRSRLKERGQHQADAEPLTVVTIEQLMYDHGWERLDLLKLDCEGCEWSILDGIQTATMDRIGVIVGEYHRGQERLRDLVARRFPGWTLRILSDKRPTWDDGAFWLFKTSEDQP